MVEKVETQSFEPVLNNTRKGRFGEKVKPPPEEITFEDKNTIEQMRLIEQLDEEDRKNIL